ncbi:hypothetical protein BGZ73_009203 [Actinomortierella ambigua]|nr:hypothetical protein BGZ73_009203 [Actinomortierella ambigua]
MATNIMENSPAKPSYSLLSLEARLGAGAYGTVYQARWGNHLCAAKTFFGSESDFKEHAIQREILLLQSLRYRHIIQFYRTHEENGRIYILMELAERGSLARAISKGVLAHDWPTKTRLASEIARGLAYLHQEKVLHRDLKSSNVLLTRHMEAKLTDFGLAKIHSMSSVGNEPSRALVGTLRWIAPELLFTSEKAYSPKSDMYSLGMVMWEMAANCTKPFKDQEDNTLVALDVCNGRREIVPEDTPPEYRKWIEHCWDQDPANRPDASDIALLYESLVNEAVEDDPLSITSFESFLISSYPAPHPRTSNRNNDELERQESPEGHDDHIGHLPQTHDDIVAYVSSAAKLGNVDFQLFLGWMFEHGQNVGLHKKDSLWWYHQAADRGHTVAQLRLAKMYEHGHVVDESDAMKAATWYQKAAAGGSAEAQFTLGKMYSDGRGVKQDAAQAVRWHRLAAVQGHQEAQFLLGERYLHGQGVLQSDKEAAKWYTKAAAQGNARAQVQTGWLYERGQGVEQSDVKAVEWYTQAAVQGNANAQAALGLMCEHGRGVEQNNVEAVKWYTKAAVQGNAEAQFSLGLIYKHGQGVTQSNDDAIKWFTRAAFQGSAQAQFNLGLIYEHGQGVQESGVEAINWYTKAASRGDSYAQASLGRMYKQGRKVEQSDEEAVKWFTMAANHGSTDAQFNLGLMYEHGRGVDQNDSEAIKWYTKAAAQGSAHAQFNLGTMHEHGQGVDQSGVEAVKWYTKAAEQGNAHARTKLEWISKHGQRVEQKDTAAAQHIAEQSNQGHSNAPVDQRIGDTTHRLQKTEIHTPKSPRNKADVDANRPALSDSASNNDGVPDIGDSSTVRLNSPVV